MNDIGFDLVNDTFNVRGKYVRTYAWAVPNEEAVETLAKLGPLVEIGAGSGYWAKMIEQNGGDIVAYDDFSWKFQQAWFDVREGSISEIHRHPDRTLFLCWPPYGDSFAIKCLWAYKGTKLAVVGERGGCTANAKFWKTLHTRWELIETVEIPKWPGLHDDLFVYERKTKSASCK